MFKSINIIACCDSKGGIGIDNELPWKISSEMKIFKDKTLGEGNNCVIMGRNTYLSIPEKYRPLKYRKNCVISSKTKINANINVIRNIEHDLIDFIKKTNYDTYWIIGGESIYRKMIEKYGHIINELHLTKLNKNYNCNKFFPVINENVFEITEKTTNYKDDFVHCIYKNKFIDQNKDYLL